MTKVETFLEERSRIPIPSGDTAWVKLLAQELALGVFRELWDRHVNDNRHERFARTTFLVKRWSTFYKSRDWGGLLEALRAFSYYEEFNSGDGGKLTQAAFDLLLTAPSFNVFISYKRSESSMLTLLVNNTLELNGVAPFFDMQLNPTDEWHARLEKRVKESNYVVLLLGPETHCSKYTVREIHWAIKHRIPVVQVWTHGYTFDASDWADIEYLEVAQKLEKEQAVVPIADSAEGYHFAMEKLLNFLGVTR